MQVIKFDDKHVNLGQVHYAEVVGCSVQLVFCDKMLQETFPTRGEAMAKLNKIIHKMQGVIIY